ncbi:DUF5316 family protein [Neobacillus niacini]|uniref:DUF5316 family protein n=1 Tax=Neobacillus niacini TaxID=86668 RepID=UPI002FFDA0BF
MIQFFLIVGVVCILISGVSIGAWTDGQQQRANYYTETTKDRHFKTKIGLYTGFGGLISLGIAGLLYFL